MPARKRTSTTKRRSATKRRSTAKRTSASALKRSSLRKSAEIKLCQMPQEALMAQTYSEFLHATKGLGCSRTALSAMWADVKEKKGIVTGSARRASAGRLPVRAAARRSVEKAPTFAPPPTFSAFPPPPPPFVIPQRAALPQETAVFAIGCVRENLDWSRCLVDKDHAAQCLRVLKQKYPAVMQTCEGGVCRAAAASAFQPVPAPPTLQQAKIIEAKPEMKVPGVVAEIREGPKVVGVVTSQGAVVSVSPPVAAARTATVPVVAQDATSKTMLQTAPKASPAQRQQLEQVQKAIATLPPPPPPLATTSALKQQMLTSAPPPAKVAQTTAIVPLPKQSPPRLNMFTPAEVSELNRGFYFLPFFGSKTFLPALKAQYPALYEDLVALRKSRNDAPETNRGYTITSTATDFNNALAAHSYAPVKFDVVKEQALYDEEMKKVLAQATIALRKMENERIEKEAKKVEQQAKETATERIAAARANARAARSAAQQVKEQVKEQAKDMPINLALFSDDKNFESERLVRAFYRLKNGSLMERADRGYVTALQQKYPLLYADLIEKSMKIAPTDRGEKTADVRENFNQMLLARKLLPPVAAPVAEPIKDLDFLQTGVSLVRLRGKIVGVFITRIAAGPDGSDVQDCYRFNFEPMTKDFRSFLNIIEYNDVVEKCLLDRGVALPLEIQEKLRGFLYAEDMLNDHALVVERSATARVNDRIVGLMSKDQRGKAGAHCARMSLSSPYYVYRGQTDTQNFLPSFVFLGENQKCTGDINPDLQKNIYLILDIYQRNFLRQNPSYGTEFAKDMVPFSWDVKEVLTRPFAEPTFKPPTAQEVVAKEELLARAAALPTMKYDVFGGVRGYSTDEKTRTYELGKGYEFNYYDEPIWFFVDEIGKDKQGDYIKFERCYDPNNKDGCIRLRPLPKMYYQVGLRPYYYSYDQKDVQEGEAYAFNYDNKRVWFYATKDTKPYQNYTYGWLECNNQEQGKAGCTLRSKK